MLFQKNVITLRSIISLINLFWERWAPPHQKSEITYFQTVSGKGLVHPLDEQKSVCLKLLSMQNQTGAHITVKFQYNVYETLHLEYST